MATTQACDKPWLKVVLPKELWHKYMMKNAFKTILGLLIGTLTTISTSLYADETGTLLYISPQDYKYSVHLSHPYYDYWFEQGPLLEPVAFEALQAAVPGLKICTGNETANTIISIKPSIFYNSQLRMYYSKLEATVYAGNGNLLGSYEGEAQQQGFNSVDNGTEYHLSKVYALAMQDLMTKLQINPSLAGTATDGKLACGLIGAQMDRKFRFY